MSERSDDSSGNTIPPAETELVAPADHVEPAEVSEDEATIARLEMRAAMFSGPLPPPELLRQYEGILPGLPERIVSSWEEESKHRRSLEGRAVGISERGQWIAATLAVLFLAVSGLLIYSGQSIAGVALLIAEITGLVAVFVYDRKESRLLLEAPEEDSAPEQ